MDDITNFDGRKRQRILAGAFLAAVILLAAGSLVPLGYSVKENAVETAGITESAGSTEKAVDERAYTESYQMAVHKDVQVNSIQLSYRAADPDFKGNLTASICEEDEVLDSSSTAIWSTGEGDGFSTVELKFDVDAQLMKGREYTLRIQIDANKHDYCIEEFAVAGQSPMCDFLSEKSIVADIAYTPITPMRYGEVFYGFFILFALAGGWLILKKSDMNRAGTPVKKGLFFVQEHYNEIILLLVFLYLALYELCYAYMKATYISPDSMNYLKEADAILGGYGFNNIGRAGYSGWFATWPIGYPALIAAMAFLTGRNIYLASKMLSVLLVGLFLLLLYIRFRKNAWFYSICLLNAGFLTIYKYTWSENPFILGLLVFCLILDHIVEHEKVKPRWFLFLGLSSVYLFLCRYFGTFSFLLIVVMAVFYLGIYVLKGKQEGLAFRTKMAGCMGSAVLSGAFIAGYYFMNYRKVGTISGSDRGAWWDEYSALTNNFYNALVQELHNAFGATVPEAVTNASRHVQVWIIVLFLAVVIYLLYRYRPKDFRAVFIGVGIFYYLVFTFVRYHSSMDSFSYRFFAPASILITIGLTGFLADFLNRHRNRIAPVAACLLGLWIASLAVQLSGFDRWNTAYSQLVTDLSGSVEAVPPHSTILGAEELDYKAALVRPDILYVGGLINRTDTMDMLFERYGNSDYICIKAKYVKEILFDPIYDYDRSVIEFFGGITEDVPDEEYLIISVQERSMLR